mmetsp:Transcript_4027/g.12234  ORF Transcript_4027/g.12234 Transcript_4027/m.12234 type:complete len:241 (-) Transcript_4027:656-1378(-)
MRTCRTADHKRQTATVAAISPPRSSACPTPDHSTSSSSSHGPGTKPGTSSLNFASAFPCAACPLPPRCSRVGALPGAPACVRLLGCLKGHAGCKAPTAPSRNRCTLVCSRLAAQYQANPCPTPCRLRSPPPRPPPPQPEPPPPMLSQPQPQLSRPLQRRQPPSHPMSRRRENSAPRHSMELLLLLLLLSMSQAGFPPTASSAALQDCCTPPRHLGCPRAGSGPASAASAASARGAAYPRC